jgi:hypothetical protein
MNLPACQAPKLTSREQRQTNGESLSIAGENRAFRPKVLRMPQATLRPGCPVDSLLHAPP